MIKSTHFFIFIFLAMSCFGQETATKTDTTKTKSIGFECKLGFMYLDFDNLNKVLKANGVAVFESQAQHFRYALRTQNDDKWGALIGFEMIHGEERDAHGFNIDNLTGNVRNFTGYGIFSEYDYYALRKKAVDLYPSLGIGFVRSSLRITDNMQPGFNFTNSIHSTAITRKYSAWDMYVDLGLNLTFKFYLFGDLSYLGMYSGYRVDFSDNEWKLDENVPLELPKFNLNGWQWGITFGSEFGSERIKQNQLKKKEKKG